MIDACGETLSLGFIGGSLQSAVGSAHHCAAIMDNVWRIDAGCFSRTQDINHATGRALGVAPHRVHDDWRGLIAAERTRLDAVVVLTPTASHAPIVAACLDAGLPVICEKALASTGAEARQLAALRDRRRGFLAVTYNYSGYPMIRQLRHMVRSGALGRLVHFQIEMPQEGFIRTDGSGRTPMPQAWRLRDGNLPTIYLDLGVHLHQLLHYLTGEQPWRVVAEQGNHGAFKDVIDDVNCLCRYSNGLYGHIWFSKSAVGHRNGLRLRLYGTEAAAEWYQGNPEDLQVNYGDGRRTILDRAVNTSIAGQRRYARFKPGHPAGFIEAFANLYGDIATALLRWRATGAFDSEEVFSAELAAEGLRFLEAIRDSVVMGQWRDIEHAELCVAA
jgi:predicted dehydrogenase